MNSTNTIRDVVADDYRAAAVFQKHGIDFCCGGDRPIADACREKGIEDQVVLDELDAALAPGGDLPRFNASDLDFLVDYIVANHHAYVRDAIQSLRAHTSRVAEVHGERHPEVVTICRRFEAIADEMTHHMFKEERILFPYVSALAAAARTGTAMRPAPFGTAANPIRMMEAEHESAGATMAEIRQLSGSYTPPEDACTTFKVCYRELEAFEADLHRHVHLENNILFPKALRLEAELLR
ncbi:MAG: iron-sulfur cluster repair di-iron protein [Acidobacteria bacterium]|nr:MAG: iron-sulfur cluster repair di-iron protein [Acidobacteriota bacterium]